MLMAFCTETDLDSPELQNINSLVNTLILNSLDQTGSDLTITGDTMVMNGDMDAIDYHEPSGHQTIRQHGFAEAMIRAVLEAEQVHPDAESWVRENMRLQGQSIILIEKGLKYNLECTSRPTGERVFYKGQWHNKAETIVAVSSIEQFDFDVWDDEAFPEYVIEDYRGLEEYDEQWHRTSVFDAPLYLTEDDPGIEPGELAICCSGHMAEVGDMLTLSECHLHREAEGAYEITEVSGDWVHIQIGHSVPESIGFPLVQISYRNLSKNVDIRPSVYDGEAFLFAA